MKYYLISEKELQTFFQYVCQQQRVDCADIVAQKKGKCADADVFYSNAPDLEEILDAFEFQTLKITSKQVDMGTRKRVHLKTYNS
jgi:hypothetical protein